MEWGEAMVKMVNKNGPCSITHLEHSLPRALHSVSHQDLLSVPENEPSIYTDVFNTVLITTGIIFKTASRNQKLIQLHLDLSAVQ